MPIGTGKYYSVCELALLTTKAAAAALIIMDGSNGSGFSMDIRDPKYLKMLPDMLEYMAKEMRGSLIEAEIARAEQALNTGS